MVNPLGVLNLEEGCIQCLSYFGIFSYPLTSGEVQQFNPFKATEEEVELSLKRLVESGKIFKLEEFYALENDSRWLEERLAGNARAMKLLDRSSRFVRVIASFPFVKAIAISGSLSKYYASENPDIDYFIITEPDRLWIARSFLHFFKKLTFLAGHQHYYCMNYFIDTRALSIKHRNQYAAIEMATLLPAFNTSLIEEFYKENKWVQEFLPNHPGITKFDYVIKQRPRYCKKLFEWILNLLCPSRFNKFLMKLTDRKWRKKWQPYNYSEEEYNRAFQTELHISKNHPMDYEKRVLNALEIEDKNQIS